MKCNVGMADRIIRIVIGLVIVALGVYFNNWWGVVGIVPLATGIFKWCPVYVPFKISTICKKEE